MNDSRERAVFRADPSIAIQSEDCDCLREKRDLWLCGLSDEPNPPYEIADRGRANDAVINGALLGACGENLDHSEKNNIAEQ